MIDDPLGGCLLLDTIPHVARRAWAQVLQLFPSVPLFLRAEPAAWRAAGLDAASAQRLQRARDGLLSRPPSQLLAARERLAKLRVDAIAICDSRYPALLRTLSMPPPWLYTRGEHSHLALPQVALVGSRKASPLGVRAATELACELTVAGFAVTSGLALGIDAAAHRGALAGRGPTIAVMASGIDSVYPRRHSGLAEAICENGCLVTEFPPATPPRRVNFPQRNRIISGIALATVVVEAALPSGSLLTAQAALNQGREVMALPWSVFHRGADGGLQLLRDGAVLVQSAQDVTANLGWYDGSHGAAAAPRGRARAANLPPLAVDVLAQLGDGAVAPDALCALLEVEMPRLLGALSALELEGAVRQVDGGYVLARD